MEALHIIKKDPTAKHWLNMAEIELSHLFRQYLNRRLENMDNVKSIWFIFLE